MKALRSRRDPKAGIALLLALVMVAFLASFVAQFNYTSRVQYLAAAHARDDMKAYYLAKGGMRVYSLLLMVGRQGANSALGGMFSQLGIQLDGAGMVCRSIPFLDTAMLRFLAGSGGSLTEEEEGDLLGLLGLGGKDDAPERGAIDASGEADQQSLKRDLLDFEGDWKVDCQDDASRIDLNGFSKAAWLATPLEQHPIAVMLYALMAPPEYDPLFEERLKMDRWELIGNIRDWIDLDEQRSGLFGGDEEGPYARFEPRYKPKNAKMESLAELRLVAGVTDEVYETFSPALSVFTGNYKVNVNAANPTTIRALVRALVDPGLVPDMLIDQTMPALMFNLKFLPGPARNAADFINRVKAQGLPVLPAQETMVKDLIATDSRVFQLTATGYVGDSVRTIESTVRVGNASVRNLDWVEK